jgi:hypothetical protein
MAAQFRKLADYFVTASEHLAASLMCGLEPDFDMASVKDDMANTEPGFSFLEHPANATMRKAYLDLATEALTGGGTRLSKHGQWNWAAVTEYRKGAVALEEMLLGGLHTACGQAPRSGELLSVECENGPSTARGVYIWNGSVIYVVRHHKAKRLNNREFNVVRFLPARLGWVMLLYLVYIRPFAGLLRREQFGYREKGDADRQRRLLFRRDGEPRTASWLTSVLKKATRLVWPEAVGIRSYRQLSVAISERHVREIRKPFNVYDDRSAGADLNVALAWQSAHRPLERGITYGLDGAFPWRLRVDGVARVPSPAKQDGALDHEGAPWGQAGSSRRNESNESVASQAPGAVTHDAQCGRSGSF